MGQSVDGRERARSSGDEWASRIHGVVLTTALAVVAVLLGSRFPVIGGAVFGIALGMLVKATGRVRPVYGPGIAFSARQLLQYSIVLLGAGLSMGEIVTTGSRSLAVMFGTLAICLLAAWGLGRLLNISADLTTLVGVGTAICGASAIAAVAPVIEAEEQDVAYAISTIFFFNVMAVLLFPPIGRLLDLGQDAFGLWAGTAVNDTSSVVAAAFAYGAEAGAFATIVKLTRSTLIIPIALVLAGARMLKARNERGSVRAVDVRGLIPWFIVSFLIASLLNTMGVLPAPVIEWATRAAKFFIVVALTAVGLSANFSQMAKTGLRPLFLGMALWVIISVMSLVIQHMTGTLF